MSDSNTVKEPESFFTSILYPVTAAWFEGSPHERLICELDIGVARRFVGAVGADFGFADGASEFSTESVLGVALASFDSLVLPVVKVADTANEYVSSVSKLFTINVVESVESNGSNAPFDNTRFISYPVICWLNVLDGGYHVSLIWVGDIASATKPAGVSVCSGLTLLLVAGLLVPSAFIADTL